MLYTILHFKVLKFKKGGSRSGAIIATCWATLMYYGKSGYVEATRKVITTTRYMSEEIKKIDGIEIIGCPDVSVIAISKFSQILLIDNYFS